MLYRQFQAAENARETLSVRRELMHPVAGQGGGATSSKRNAWKSARPVQQSRYPLTWQFFSASDPIPES